MQFQNDMNSLAVDKDIEKDYLSAVELYEKEINKEDVSSIDSYLNLAFLYWWFASEQMSFNIPDEMSLLGGNRYSIVIDLGIKEYPNNVELHLWKRYFDYILFGNQFSQKDCESIINEFVNEEGLVSYFFLNMFNKGNYKVQINMLLKQCEELPTAKNNYIKSVINV